MLLSPDDFIGKIDSLYTSDPVYLRQLKYYREWLGYHGAAPAKYYFIETLARKFAHEVLNSRNDVGMGGDDYEIYLERISSSFYATVKAHGVYQLCLLWNRQASKYFPSRGYAYDYLGATYRNNNEYDTGYRYHAVKALRLFEQNKMMLDSFTYLKNILLRMEQQILESEVNIAMEKNSLPGEPMLAELTFKNAGKLYYSIVRRNNGFSFTFRTKQERIRILRQLPELVNHSIDLPSTDDHNAHEAYLRLEGLPAGNYDLLFSHLPLSDSNKQVEQLFFKVTSIAVINNDKRVFVLDRKTGFPLAGAKIRGSYKQDTKTTSVGKLFTTKAYTINEQGFVIIDDKKIKGLEVYYENDTTSSEIDFSDEDKPDDVYDKDEYDRLEEFYEDNASVHIFTDRSIYRPGQTVYFKAIFLTKNKNTGEAIVMSKENMKGSLFNRVFKKWLKESQPELYFTDPFDRKIDTIKVKPNEYGSVSGSFKIPKTAATGQWSIETDAIDEDRSGKFSVEEYKRPSYEISIEGPKKELLPGDSFSVRVKVRSFAGAPLNNVLINYRLARSGMLPWFDAVTGKMATQNVNENLADTFAYTNAVGEFVLTVNDSLLKKYRLGNATEWSFDYDTRAEAVDITGESYSVASTVFISSRPVNIKLPFADKYKRDEMNSVLITASERNVGKVSKNVRIKIYRIVKDEKLYGSRKLVRADHWLYDPQRVQQWFPFINILNREDSGTKKLMLETTVNTGKNEKLDIDPLLFVAGNYVAEAESEENGKLLGENKKYFSVYDENENKLPQSTWSFYHLPYNSAFPGDTIKYYNGNSEKPVYSIYHLTWYSGKKKAEVSQSYEIVKQKTGINKWKWKVPKDAMDQALLTQFYIVNNEVFSHHEAVYINSNLQTEPGIIIEQYRNKLSPGSKETFSVSIKTKNENTVAELMTTMYDASLDKLEQHKWEKPRTERHRNLGHDPDKDINSLVRNSYYYNDEYYRETGFVNPGHTGPLWWVNPLDHLYDADVMGDWNNVPRRMRNPGFQSDMNPDVRWSGDNYSGAFGYDNASMLRGNNYLLAGRAAGLTITNTDGLNEVVVVGYGTVRKRDITGSVANIIIRGASLASYSQPLIILDGVPFEGDLSKIDPNTITQGIILKGADAAAIYGARASNGVLVLSTKGEIVFPTVPYEPPPPPRKNFNETAFFFPSIYADKDGYYRFTFTMPESVTEWNWKMMAHTKKAQFAYAERKLNTQLPLMVQPNMPRLLYQGDRIVLQNRITNLDSITITGKAFCKIEDAVTGEDISSVLLAHTENGFSVNKIGNISSAFEIKVPRTQLNPIKIVVSAHSGNFADAEEHIIPILSPKILVKQSQAFRFVNNMDTTIQPVTLPADAELYGVGLSILPKSQSALVNALPYLANYSFDCAEQIFNKILARLIAVKIMREDKETNKAFERLKQVATKEDEQKETAADINEQSMPWLNLGNKTRQQKKQLFELLDTARTASEIRDKMRELYKLQNKDGGLTWFEGGKSNGYISDYVLAGFGKLKKEGLQMPAGVFDKDYGDFIGHLVGYCNQHQGDDGDILFHVYARSFWKDNYPLTDSAVKRIINSLSDLWNQVDRYDLNKQALLIISTLRWFDKGSDHYKKAIAQLNSIEQLTIRDENGMRWKDLADSDDMSNTAEETLVVLLEAFEEKDVYPEIFQGVTRWLLSAKDEDHWSSTKATSSVINMLLKVLPADLVQTIHGRINSKELSVTDDMLNGDVFSFAKLDRPGPVNLKKQETNRVSGNLTWYYFSTNADPAKLNKEVSLIKELSRYNSNTGKWEPITGTTTLKPGDRISVTLTIETAKALRYVYIDDKRAAAFEPKETHSGNEYASGFSY